jgi:hypothetical protein
MIYIVDDGAESAASAPDTSDITTYLLTADLVPVFERKRKEYQRNIGSFRPTEVPEEGQPPSAGGQGSVPSVKTVPSKGAAPKPGSTPRSTSARQDKLRSDPYLAPLESAALPSYTLASIDGAALAGSSPGLLASFLIGLGFQQSESLQVEADSVEIASLPTEDLMDALDEVCADDRSPIGNITRGASILNSGNEILYNFWAARLRDYGPSVVGRYRPGLYLVTRIYYLKTIKYIYSDQRAYEAELRAAEISGLEQGETPVPLPAVTVNVDSNAAGGKSPEPNAQLEALRKTLSEYIKAVGSSQSPAIAASATRATARGVEITDTFTEPMAFGYEAISDTLYPRDQGSEKWSDDRWNWSIKDKMGSGIRSFCDIGTSWPYVPRPKE